MSERLFGGLRDVSYLGVAAMIVWSVFAGGAGAWLRVLACLRGECGL